MPNQSRGHFSDETIDAIQELIRANIDSHEGFACAADHVDDGSVGELFKKLALQRLENSWKLHKLVVDNESMPATTGTLKGGLHRAFMELRSKISGDDLVFIEEACRGEGYLRTMYESLLHSETGSEIDDLLKEQYASIKADHDRLGDLRERMARSQSKE